MTKIEDLMSAMDLEAAIRIEVVVEVVEEAEATAVVEVGEEAVLVEAEVVTTEGELVGKEEHINRSTMWALVVVDTTHREASQITMIMYRVETTTMLRFRPWAAEGYLMASKPARYVIAKTKVRARSTSRVLDEGSITSGALVAIGTGRLF